MSHQRDIKNGIHPRPCGMINLSNIISYGRGTLPNLIDIRISNRTFPNIRKVISESPLFETNETMLIRTSKLKSEKGILLNAFCKSEEEALYVKNPRLKSRASDSPSGFFSLATRLHLPFYLLSCFICPMHLPSGRVLLRLSVSILTLPVLLRCRLFKWTFTTAPTLPRGTAASLSSHSRFRSACLYVTGFARYLVNSYF